MISCFHLFIFVSFSEAYLYESLVFEGEMTEAVVRLVIKSVFLLYFSVFDAQNALNLLTSFKTAHSKKMVALVYVLDKSTNYFII